MEKREYWLEHFEKYRESGLSVQSYCDRERITKSTFDYWKTRFRKEVPESGFVAITPSAGALSSVRRPEVVKIELRGGTVIRVADLSALDTVLRALQSSSSC